MGAGPMESISALHWLPQYYVPVVVLATAAVCFPVAFYATSIEVFTALLRRRGVSGEQLSVWAVVMQRVAGGAVLVLVPAAVARAMLPPQPSHYGLVAGPPVLTAKLAALGIAGAAVVLYLVYRFWPAALVAYPQMRVQHWTSRLIALNVASWAVYLAAYESFFRGFQLFPLAASFGSWPAIALVTALFVYSHLPELPQEPAGAALIGPYYGVATLVTGSVLAAFLIHLFIALASEAFGARIKGETLSAGARRAA
jgi:membrane protease YdiL (CAAX protease family)